MRKRVLSVLMTLAAVLLVGCTSSQETVSIKSLEDLAGKVIGVQAESTGDYLASDEIYGAQAVERFETPSLAVQALEQCKVDCLIMEVDTANMFASDNLSIHDVGFEPEQFAIAVQTGNTDMLFAVNDVIAQMRSDGSLFASIAVHEDMNGSSPDCNTGAANGRLVVGTEAGFAPYEYFSGSQIIGTDIDIMAQVAQNLDLELIVANMRYDDLVPALLAGEIDAVAAALTVNADRTAKLNLSDPYIDATNVVLVRSTLSDHLESK